MTKEQARPTPLNGWREFSPGLQPWTDDVVFWAFRADGRKTFTVLYDTRILARWRRLNGTPLMAGDVDYVLPVSAAKPPAPDQQVFENPLPVVVMLVVSNRGLIAIRRGLQDGFGQIAMPGGYHNLGETWQQAGCREFFEETGVVLDPSRVKVYDVVTVQNGKVNLIFGIYEDVVIDPVFTHDGEVLEVLELGAPVETAFPAHTEIMARYMAVRFPRD